MITHFTIFGERCTGTNYLEKILLLNFNVKVTWIYGWKHFPLKETEYVKTNNTLFICLVRNILDWLNCFYKNMHYLPLQYNNDITESEKINKFLNDEFWSCDDRYGKPEILNELRVDDKFLDRNIYTGERYKNIFEMRSTKLRYLLEELPKTVKNYIFIRYEDLLYNFENTLTKIKNKGLYIKKIDIFPININKSSDISDTITSEKDRIIKEDMVFNNENFLKYDKYEGLIYKDVNVQNNLTTINKNVILDIFNNIGNNKNMLVFGLGVESKMWYEKNGNNTYFVEDKDENIDLVKNDIPQDNIIKYEYKTCCKTCGLLKSKQIKEFKIPEQLLRLAPFDVILIDGPDNYHSGGYIKKYAKKPGRLIPCYWSSLLNKPGTLIYLNDSEHVLENYYIKRFFNDNVKEEFIGVQNCTKIYC
jgi:hypothetical protein